MSFVASRLASSQCSLSRICVGGSNPWRCCIFQSQLIARAPLVSMAAINCIRSDPRNPSPFVTGTPPSSAVRDNRSPFRGKVFVSYHSPDGTPFYYPGEGFADLGIHPNKLLQPGDPDTFQVKIRDVMPVGYFVDMPSGREGYLPANDLGFSGGIERLRTIFQVGQEVTVRITFRGGGGRELLSIRKYDPDRPPVEPPKVARSSGSGKRKISSMMRRRAQQQQQQQNNS